MSSGVAIPLFAVSLVVTLGAARSFARRLDLLATRFGMPEAVIGLLTALAADGPEITSALVALASGAHSASVGVLVGSNIFNIAAMIGLSALLAGRISIALPALALEGTVAVLVTIIAGAVLLGAPAAIAAALMALAIVPYLLLLLHGPPLVARLRLHGAVVRAITRALGERDTAARVDRDGAEVALHLQLPLLVLDAVLIVAGSIGMVETALTLGDRWGLARGLVGVLVLAPLTSLPNALTGVRLGLAGRGSALVSETFNSNTINLVGGVSVPALFVALGSLSALARDDLGWLLAINALCLLLLARGAGRLGGAALIAAYAAFVATQL